MIKGLHYVRKRLAGGVQRWYVYPYRGSGSSVMESDGAAKPTLTNEALAAVSEARKKRKEAQQADPDTLLSLIRAWRSSDPQRPSSPEWEALAASTKKTWGSALDRIEEKWGHVPLAVFNDPRMAAKVIAWRDSRAATPRAADIGVTVLQALLKFGKPRGFVRINVADEIGKLYRNGQRAEIIWTDADLAAFAEAAGEKDRCIDDAVQLAAVTGLRREDLARATLADVRDSVIVKKAAKVSRGKRRFATIPRVPQLDAVLERLKDRHRAEGVNTILVNRAGQPWNLDTLSKEVARIAKKAGIMHVEEGEPGEPPVLRRKHLHDVRGTFATRLMTTTDLTDEEIAGIMGWSPDEVKRIRAIYVDDNARNVALGRRIARGCKPEM